jgi:hypothetical protein
MKYDWKKLEREIYNTKGEPYTVVVPRQSYIMIKGVGNPNNEDFSERVGALYSLAYAIKFGYRAAYSSDGELRARSEYSDYGVFPLEGVWTTANAESLSDKDSYMYTIMIRQPDFITEAMFEAALEATRKKKPNPLLDEILFNWMEDGMSVQMLHTGSYDDEPASFARMDAFAAANALERTDSSHREIYLNDARRTAPEKRRTVLRYRVRS